MALAYGVDNSIGILGYVVGIPLKTDVVGDLGEVKKDLGRSSASHTVSTLDRTRIRRCSARTLVWLEKKEMSGQKYTE